MDPTKSRGFRNRNPGNIDFNERNKWQGQIGRELTGNPPRFAMFDSHENGIRALASLLTVYQDRHNLRTVRKIVNRWAPPVENQTSAYVNAVARSTGFDADDQLDLHTYAHLRPLVEAIIKHEIGGNPYSAAVIDEGLRRAGVPKPIRTVAEAASTGTGKGAITAAGATGAVAVAVQAAPAIESVGKLPPVVGVALILVVAVVIVLFVLKRRKGH